MFTTSSREYSWPKRAEFWMASLNIVSDASMVTHSSATGATPSMRPFTGGDPTCASRCRGASPA